MTSNRTGRGRLNTVLVITGAATVFSGFLIQIYFHRNRLGGPVWGLGHADWNHLHQVASFAFLAGVVWHLSMNWKAFRVACSPRRSWRRLGFYLTALFGMVVSTALSALGAGWLAGPCSAEHVGIEIHDKVAIPLAVVLLVHGWQRRRRLFRPA